MIKSDDGNKHGEENPNAKLTEEKVIEIITTNTCGHELAKKFGVSFTRIKNIREKRGWLRVHEKLSAINRPQEITSDELPRGI